MKNFIERIIAMMYYHCHNRYWDRGMEYPSLIIYISVYVMMVYVSGMSVLFPLAYKPAVFSFAFPFFSSVICLLVFLPKKKMDLLITVLTEKEKHMAKFVFWGIFYMTFFFCIFAIVLHKYLSVY